MAKQSGLGDRLLVAGFNISGDISALDEIGGGNEPLVVTGIDKEAFERLGGKRDGRINATSYFNPSTDQAHDVFSALPTSDRLVTYLRGVGLGSPAACLLAKQIGYDGNRGNDGSLTFAVESQGQGFGLEWGDQHTPGIREDTGATNGAGVDAAASSAFGLQAYLQVLSFTGTDATVTLQESADDAAVDPYVDVVGGAFTQITGVPTVERIATSGSQAVEQWIRVVTTTSGGFSELSFVVVVVRNETEPRF